MTTENVSFLIDKFEEFYREVHRLARDASGRGPLRTAGALFSLPGDPSISTEKINPADLSSYPKLGAVAPPGAATPSSVRLRLVSVLERQSLDVRRSGGDYAAALYKEAQFVMAALTDEVFLYLDWPGRDDWSSNILESQLFGSHRAGEEIYDEIDRFLAARNPVYVDMAKVYLMALSLGFEGKFRGAQDGPQQIASYRRRLMEFISGEEPELRETARLLVPDAYASTFDQGVSSRLPYLKFWGWAAMALLVVWLLMSHFLWRQLVAPLEPDIRSILQTFSEV